jgi:uncharacterized membrane protein
MNKEEQIAKAEESVITKPSDILQSDAFINTKKTVQIAQYAEFFQGPLPHPNLLRQYNDIVPRFAQEVTKAMIEQSQHRREIEKLVIVSKIEQAKRGQYIAAFVTALLVGLSAYMVKMGHLTEAAVVVGINLTALIGVFITNKESQRKELKEKAEAVPEPGSSPAKPLPPKDKTSSA